MSRSKKVKCQFWGPDPQPLLPGHIWFGALRSHWREAPYSENGARIRRVVPEIRRPKFLHFWPPSGKTGSGRGQMTSPTDSARRGLRPTKVSYAYGARRRRQATLNFFRICPIGKSTNDGVDKINSSTLSVFGVARTPPESTSGSRKAFPT